MLSKLCRHGTCNKVIDIRDNYCEQHESAGEEKEAERQRYYDTWHRDERSRQFYSSKEWRQVRQVALVRDSYLCQDCLKQKRITKARLVHHIVEIKEDWDKRLELDNLLSVCDRCHAEYH